MKHLFCKTIVLIVLFLFAKPVFGAVVINEVFYDPTGTDTGLEYIVLYNNDATSYVLDNHCLYASDKHFVFPSFTLGAKQQIIIHWNTNGTNTSTDLYTGTTNWSNMGNSSGSVALFLNYNNPHNSLNIIDFIQYIKKETWESAATDAGIWTANTFIPNISVPGKAIKLQTNGTDNNLPSDWTETTPSIVQPETPSSSTEEETTSSSEETLESQANNNPPLADAGDNIIGFVDQEIIFDGSKSSDADDNELSYSWNTGDGNSLDKISLTHKYPYPGIYLVTLTVFDGKYYASDTITVKIQQAQITINEFLPNPSGKDEEEEWIEIYNGADSISDISGWQLDDAASGSKAFVFPKNTFIAPKNYLVLSRQTTKIALNNDIDSVRLLMPDGIVFQEIKYEKPPQGKSSARTEEGFVWSEPTPGMANISGIVISPNKQTASQMNIVAPQITKNSTKTYTIDLPKNDIEGGYITNNDQFIISNDQTPIQKTNQLAGITQFTNQSPLNLTLFVICIIFGAGLLGLLLVKLKKKKLPI